MKYVLDASVAVNDCLYVALAERERCQLLTADTRLITNLQASFPFITSLATLITCLDGVNDLGDFGHGERRIIFDKLLGHPAGCEPQPIRKRKSYRDIAELTKPSGSETTYRISEVSSWRFSEYRTDYSTR
jgi:hypothetical protein